MARVWSWLLHALVTVVVVRGVGAFARSVGATAYVGLAVVTALGVAVAGTVTALLLARARDQAWTSSATGHAARLAPVPVVLAVVTGWEVARAGGGAVLVLLAVASWLLGAGGGIAGAMLVTRRRTGRAAGPTDWAVLP